MSINKKEDELKSAILFAFTHIPGRFIPEIKKSLLPSKGKIHITDMQEITWADFEKVELRVGTILEVYEFPEARKPAYKLKVDFGEFGIRTSSAQITKLYQIDELPGRQIVGVINFPKKQIGKFSSEFLITGFADANGDIVLTTVEREVPNGSRMC